VGKDRFCQKLRGIRPRLTRIFPGNINGQTLFLAERVGQVFLEEKKLEEWDHVPI
jgi:hypothetical protein